MSETYFVINAELKSQNFQVNTLKKPNSLILSGLRRLQNCCANSSMHDIEMIGATIVIPNDFFKFAGRNKL
jgi:hypothetical protein